MTRAQISTLPSSAYRAPFAVVVADDLTGACDAGAEFAKRGLVTRVGLCKVPSVSPDVLVVSTHTRDIEAATAAHRTMEIAEHLPASTPLLFRKIDSTLRGNVVSECNALMDSLSVPIGILAPSLPSQGRTVTDGTLHIRDIAGTRVIDIAGLMSGQGASLVTLPSLDDSEALRQAMEHAARQGARYVLCEATTDAHLQVIARAAQACRPRPLWIGSAGLAGQAARLLAPTVQAQAASSWRSSDAPILFCVGSPHAVSALQLAHLCNRHSARVFDAAGTSSKELAAAVSRGEVIILKIHAAMDPPEQLVKLLQAALDAGVGRIFMSGGDTAELLCRTAGTDHLLLHGEILPGVAESTIQGGLLNDLLLATKSGGFGQEDCLSEILCPEAMVTPRAVEKEDA